MNRPQDRRPARAPSAIGATVERLTRPVFGKRGFTVAAIVTEWPAIAGPHLAAHTLPERIAFPRGDGRTGGTLHLRVDSGSLALELQHLAPLLVERVNGFFGYAAVTDLRLVRGRLPAREDHRRRSPRPLSAAEEAALSSCLEAVTDPDLRAALEGLGRAVIGRGDRATGGAKK